MKRIKKREKRGKNNIKEIREREKRERERERVRKRERDR